MNGVPVRISFTDEEGVFRGVEGPGWVMHLESAKAGAELHSPWDAAFREAIGPQLRTNLGVRRILSLVAIFRASDSDFISSTSSFTHWSSPRFLICKMRMMKSVLLTSLSCPINQMRLRALEMVKS